jgi:hypothetical protein
MPNKQTPTKTELKYDKADRLGILPANWLPPEEPALEATHNKRNYSTELAKIRRKVGIPNFARPAGRRGARRQGIAQQQIGSIYPTRANFKHMDVKKFSVLEEAAYELMGQHTFGSKRKSKAQEGGSVLTLPASLVGNRQHLQQKLQVAKKQYERLESAFKWIICKICDCCVALNKALKEKDPDQYRQAKENYVQLLQNLNIHDPRGNQIDPQKGFGYGRVLGWTFVDVVVEHNDEHDENLITGVTIVGEWIGYHTSSSGVPIP